MSGNTVFKHVLTNTMILKQSPKLVPQAVVLGSNLLAFSTSIS